MNTLLWIILLPAAMWVLHRIALWAEKRGWIFYKHRKASPGTAGRAFMEVQSLLEPGVRQVVDSRERAFAEEDDSGDPPADGDAGNGSDHDHHSCRPPAQTSRASLSAVAEGQA